MSTSVDIFDNDSRTERSMVAREDSLTIVIPALNEEEAIGGTIERCLAARSSICAAARIEKVEVIVVNDGSTDRTGEIAAGFGDDVHVITFAKNKGYGAAIKEGFRHGRGSLVGFLDADGTCDPLYFGAMCQIALNDSADVVLGSRMGADSKMPPIRRLGNTIFALILGSLTGRKITDTASGMRVVRRQALRDLYPLPDGLHFTPAMSARALLNGLRVVEIPMQYEERVGRSKLSVVRDGVRFLNAFLQSMIYFRPEKLFLTVFVVCTLFVLLLAARPAEMYFAHWYLEEWMIYRFVVCQLAGSCGLLFLLAAAMANRMAVFSGRRSEADTFWPAMAARLLHGVPLALLLAALFGVGIFFLWPGIVEYVTTWQITLHWSRVIAGAFAIFSAVQAGVFACLMRLVTIWKRPQMGEETLDDCNWQDLKGRAK